MKWFGTQKGKPFWSGGDSTAFYVVLTEPGDQYHPKAWFAFPVGGRWEHYLGGTSIAAGGRDFPSHWVPVEPHGRPPWQQTLVLLGQVEEP
jgi:hypothetical protein